MTFYHPLKYFCDGGNRTMVIKWDKNRACVEKYEESRRTLLRKKRILGLVIDIQAG